MRLEKPVVSEIGYSLYSLKQKTSFGDAVFVICKNDVKEFIQDQIKAALELGVELNPNDLAYQIYKKRILSFFKNRTGECGVGTVASTARVPEWSVASFIMEYDGRGLKHVRRHSRQLEGIKADPTYSVLSWIGESNEQK